MGCVLYLLRTYYMIKPDTNRYFNEIVIFTHLPPPNTVDACTSILYLACLNMPSALITLHSEPFFQLLHLTKCDNNRLSFMLK